MDGMTYNSGGNVLAGNSKVELQLKTTYIKQCQLA
jgi:hypothetical protein